MSETAKGAGSGALQWAAAGAAVGGVPGAIVGAVVGGVWGAIGGKFGDKAKKKAKQAKQIQQLREQEAYRQQYLSLLRQSRIQRASSLSLAVAMGSEEGSGAQGSLSSIGSQIANQVEYMSVDRGRELMVSHLTSKAQKLSKKSQDTMGALSTTATVVGLSGAAMSAAATSGAATASSSASAGNAVGASGIGSSTANASLQSTGLAAGGMGPIAPTASNWQLASSSLMKKAMTQYMVTTTGTQIGRAIYSGTKLQ